MYIEAVVSLCLLLKLPFSYLMFHICLMATLLILMKGSHWYLLLDDITISFEGFWVLLLLASLWLFSVDLWRWELVLVSFPLFCCGYVLIMWDVSCVYCCFAYWVLLNLVHLSVLCWGTFLSSPNTGGGPSGPHGLVERAMHRMGFLGCFHDMEADVEFLELHLVEECSTLCTLLFINVLFLYLMYYFHWYKGSIM